MPTRTWLNARGVTVKEWHCPGAERALGPEESVSAFEVSVVRVGAYARRLPGRTVQANPATLVCANPDVPFRMVHEPGRAARETVLSLDEPSFRSLLSGVNARAADASRVSFARDSVPLQGRASLLHAALLRTWRDGGEPVGLQELALALVRTVLGTPPAQSPPGLSPRAREAVHHVRSVLAERFGERLTLDELGALVGLTPWHLSRVFRQATGESVHRYLSRVRLAAALERIALREPNLTRIALECGFSSHSHFTSAFRARYGSSPTRLRLDPAVLLQR